MSNEVSTTQGAKAKLLKLMGTIKQAEQEIEKIFSNIPLQERQEFEQAVESWFKSK